MSLEFWQAVFQGCAWVCGVSVAVFAVCGFGIAGNERWGTALFCWFMALVFVVGTVLFYSAMMESQRRIDRRNAEERISDKQRENAAERGFVEVPK